VSTESQAAVLHPIDPQPWGPALQHIGQPTVPQAAAMKPADWQCAAQQSELLQLAVQQPPVPQPTALFEAMNTSTSKAKKATANVDYEKFDRLALAVASEIRGEVVAILGRKGWNSTINGIYFEDGMLNGRPRLRKRGELRWLKFNDAGQWMISQHQDGRPLGEALAAEAPAKPGAACGMWHVCNEQCGWEADPRIFACSALCGHCGVVLERPNRCGTCWAVSYCGGRCQRADWRFHRRICSPHGQTPEGQPGGPANTSLEPPGAEGDGKELLPAPPLRGRRVVAGAQAPPAEPLALLTSGVTAKVGQAVGCAAPLSQWNGACTWEERNLRRWADQHLAELLAEPPELRVPCGQGHVQVTGVREIEGFATVGINRAERRHLFDLHFEVTFQATWIGDWGKLSAEGAVSMVDFSSTLGSNDVEDMVCGMEVDFKALSEAALPSRQRADIIAALGASRRDVLRGHGLMHLVHRRLLRFAEDFAQQ